jgi:hypothetical protein
MVVGGLGLVAAVGVLALVVLHKKPSQAELPPDYFDERLREAVAEADRADPRWRFADLDADRASVPFDENAAPLLMACGKLIPPELNGLETGPVRTRLRDGVIDEKPRQDIEPAQAMLFKARELANFNRGRHDVKWNLANPLATPQPHVAVTNDVVDLLTLDAEVSAHEGKTDAALVSIRAALVAVHAIGDEPMPASQVARFWWGHFAVGALEESLRRGQGTEARLLGVQQALEAEAAEPVLRMAARAERAGLHALMTSLESGDVTRAELSALGEHGEGTGLVMTKRRETLEAIHAWLLDYLTRFVAITELPSEQQAPRLKELAATIPEAPPEAMPLLRAFPILDIATKCHNGRSLLRCAAVGMALERYRLANGGWPETLAALVPKYLKEVPADPFDGKPVRYLRARDGVVVYSVGAAGKEIVEARDLESFAKTDVADLSFRLWNVAARGKK